MENYKNTDSMNWVPGKVEGFSGKNLIDLDKGGLKKVKIEPFATYPSHLHPDKTEYIYVLKGSPKVEIGENTFTGTLGNFFILPHSIKHSIANPSEEDCQLLVGSISN